MGADHSLYSEFALHLTPMPQVGPPVSGQWARGDVILDTNLDMYGCLQASQGGGQGQPAVWKQLGGGSGSTLIAVEDLSSQIDGQTDTFTTSQAISTNKLSVYRNGQHMGTPGTIPAAHVEILTPTSFKIEVVPAVGEALHVWYVRP